MKEVKKEFELDIVSKIKEGKNPSQIAKELNLSLPNLSYYIKKLKSQGIIQRKSYGVWEVLKDIKTFSLGTTNLHALQIYAPILSGQINDSDWEIKEKLNNWIPKYTELKSLGGIKIKNNNNKSITVWAESRDIKNVEEIRDLAFKIRIYLYNYFRNKYEVELDLMAMEVKNLDVATEDENAESMLGKGEKFKLKFNKKAEKIFEKDNRNSEAWLDGSPFKFSAETNDLDWKREYLKMPFTLREIKEMAMYSIKFYSGHVGIVEKLNKILEVPEVKKHISKTIKEKNQSKLGDFL